MRKFTIEWTDKGDSIECVSENNGFNAMELMGLLESKQMDIKAQITPTCNFKRTLIDDGNKIDISEKEEQ